MKLRPGITSFFDPQEPYPLPEYSIVEFKRLVQAVAAARGWTVESVTKAGVTPNFHIAAIKARDVSRCILGHSNFPIVAVAAELRDTDQCLQFVDDPLIEAEIIRLYPEVEIAGAADLHRPLADFDLALLGHADLTNVRYWKPQTVGQLVFNWWD